MRWLDGGRGGIPVTDLLPLMVSFPHMRCPMGPSQPKLLSFQSKDVLTARQEREVLALAAGLVHRKPCTSPAYRLACDLWSENRTFSVRSHLNLDAKRD